MVVNVRFLGNRRVTGEQSHIEGVAKQIADWSKVISGSCMNLGGFIKPKVQHIHQAHSLLNTDAFWENKVHL